MLAVPRTAKPLSWHGKQLAEMQHGASRAPMEARRDGGAQRLGADASPRRPAESRASFSHFIFVSFFSWIFLRV